MRQLFPLCNSAQLWRPREIHPEVLPSLLFRCSPLPRKEDHHRGQRGVSGDGRPAQGHLSCKGIQSLFQSWYVCFIKCVLFHTIKRKCNWGVFTYSKTVWPSVFSCKNEKQYFFRRGELNSSFFSMWLPVDPGPSVVPSPNCGANLVQPKGEVSGTSYPAPFKPLEVCRWRIRNTPGTATKLTFANYSVREKVWLKRWREQGIMGSTLSRATICLWPSLMFSHLAGLRGN